MRKLLICAVIAGCASEPTASVSSQIEGESCSVTPIQCYPLEDGLSYCSAACGNVLAYCREYTDRDYRFCHTLPYIDPDLCNPFGFPRWATECVLGAPATPPDAERIRTIRAARHLVERGEIERAQEVFSKVGIQYQPPASGRE